MGHDSNYLEYHGSVAQRIIRELNEKSERLLAQARLLARMSRKEDEIGSDKEAGD